MEMTGLDPDRHVTLEIATLITDPYLQVLAEGPVVAVARSDEEMARIDDWSLRTHTDSGLLERVQASAIGVEEAERLTLDFVREWGGREEGAAVRQLRAPGQALPCGRRCPRWKRT